MYPSLVCTASNYEFVVVYNSVLAVQKYLLTELVKAGTSAVIVIVRKGGPEGFNRKTFKE
jgi:hypothetical protein